MPLCVRLLVVEVQVDRSSASLGEVDRLGRSEEGVAGSVEDCSQSPKLDSVTDDQKECVQYLLACRTDNSGRDFSRGRLSQSFVYSRFEPAPHGLRKTTIKVMIQKAVRKRSSTLSGVNGYCCQVERNQTLAETRLREVGI